MMLFFYAVALPMVVCLVLYGLIWLPSKSTGLAVRIDVGLAWGAALATLILVPTDVATTLLGGSPPHLAQWWRSSYWCVGRGAGCGRGMGWWVNWGVWRAMRLRCRNA